MALYPADEDSPLQQRPQGRNAVFPRNFLPLTVIPSRVARFTEEIAPEEIMDQRMYKDPYNNVVYLELLKN